MKKNIKTTANAAEKQENSTEIQLARPAMTLEARENQIIDLAVKLAEKQLREGTASSQVICHYLKLGTTREKSEQKILEGQLRLIDAKIDNLKANENAAEMYRKAVDCMLEYSGRDKDIYDDPEELY